MKELTQTEEEFVREFFKDQPTGRFLELGAQDGAPERHNEPCWNLLVKGWHGYYCEPNPISRGQLIRNTWPYRHRTIILNTTVRGTDTLDLFYMDLGHDYSSASSLHLDWMSEQPFGSGQTPYIINVHSIGFSKLIQCVGYDFDFISIDIEGSDDEVIDSIDWNIFTNLKLICTENPKQNSLERLSQAGFVPLGITRASNVFFIKDFG